MAEALRWLRSARSQSPSSPQVNTNCATRKGSLVCAFYGPPGDLPGQSWYARASPARRHGEGDEPVPPTVLVVISTQAHCAEWQSLFGVLGCEVVAAQSGEAALAIGPSVQPDLI